MSFLAMWRHSLFSAPAARRSRRHGKQRTKQLLSGDTFIHVPKARLLDEQLAAIAVPGGAVNERVQAAFVARLSRPRDARSEGAAATCARLLNTTAVGGAVERVAATPPEGARDPTAVRIARCTHGATHALGGGL